MTIIKEDEIKKFKVVGRLSTKEFYTKVKVYINKVSKTKDLLILRRNLFFLLFYLTGAEIEVLLSLKVKHLNELIKNFKTISIENNWYYVINLNRIQNVNIEKDFSQLAYYYKYKKEEDYLFTTIKDTSKQLKKSNLIKEMQSYLDDFNKTTNENIKFSDLYLFVSYTNKLN